MRAPGTSWIAAAYLLGFRTSAIDACGGTSATGMRRLSRSEQRQAFTGAERAIADASAEPGTCVSSPFPPWIIPPRRRTTTASASNIERVPTLTPCTWLLSNRPPSRGRSGPISATTAAFSRATACHRPAGEGGVGQVRRRLRDALPGHRKARRAGAPGDRGGAQGGRQPDPRHRSRTGRRGDRLASADHRLQERDAVAERPVHRVLFHEATPNAVREAMARPRGIDLDMVNAKQAQRARLPGGLRSVARARGWRTSRPAPTHIKHEFVFVIIERNFAVRSRQRAMERRMGVQYISLLRALLPRME